MSAVHAPQFAKEGSTVRPFYARHSKQHLRLALRRMWLIRRFEEMAEESYIRGLTHGTMHLAVGQEATAVGICLDLTDKDYMTSTHRGHGHCIAKGAEVKYMFAEFFGKEEGYCRGRGGSMHIANVATGNLGANGIVGGGIPLATGAALAIKQRKGRDVAVCFFGDGANNEGAFHESANIAAVWRLPVIYVCENNQYGMSVSTARSTAVTDVAIRAAAYAMPGTIVDGNNIADVNEAMMVALERARNGEGPSLIECKTYRTKGHSRSDRNRYRSKGEIEEWKQKDPLPMFEAELRDYGVLDAVDLQAVRDDVEREIQEGFAFAQSGTNPSPDTLLRNVYTTVDAT